MQLHLPVRPAALWLFVCLLQISTRLVERSLSIVVGLNSLPVFVRSALALASDVKDLAQLNMTPNFRPSGFAVSVQAIAITIRGSLVVVLQEKYFGNTIVRQGAVLVDLECLVELCQRTRQITLLHQRLSALNSSSQLDVRRVLEQMIVGINRDPPRPSECIDRECRICSDHIDALHLSFSVGIDLQLDRHAEQVKILRDPADYPEALVVPQPVNRIMCLEFGSPG